MDGKPTPAQRKKHLLGVWRSDAARTLEELAKRRDFSKKQLEYFRTLFGKLELHYRPAKLVTVFNGRRTTGKYKILGADSKSVVILTESTILGTTITQIHFEDDHYWVNLGGGTREFFERVSPHEIPKGKAKGPQLKKWKGKRKGSLERLGYSSIDDYIRDVRGR